MVFRPHFDTGTVSSVNHFGTWDDKGWVDSVKLASILSYRLLSDPKVPSALDQVDTEVYFIQMVMVWIKAPLCLPLDGGCGIDLV